MNELPEPAQALAELMPRYPFFVGIDSDGCAFDTMEIKHKECFAPNIIKHWDLQAVARYAREAAEFVNLYSRWRGINRWPALVMVFDLLRERPEVRRRGVMPPEAHQIRAFIADGAVPKSNDGLLAYMALHPSAELERALAWSLAVNASIAEMVHGIPPFPFLRESLAFLAGQADLLVVSATPVEALAREWKEHGIDRYVRAIAGQEQGTKSQHLALSARGRYAPGRILMIGDSPGDLEAARANGALFYPVNPGYEEESWERFYREGMARFLSEEYAGAYESRLMADFEKLLPEIPPWKRSVSA